MPTHEYMHIWPGLELRGCRRSGADRNHIENGCLHTIVSVQQEAAHTGSVVVKLSPSMVMEGTPCPEIAVSFQETGQLLRYSYAATIAGCQGLTFANNTTLLSATSHQYFCTRKLHVSTGS